MKINIANPFAYPQMVDVIIPFKFALTNLGHKVSSGREIKNDGSLNIIFGAQGLDSEISLPNNTIIYNLEQTNSKFFQHGYEKLLANAEIVWDYSQENTRSLAESFGISAKTVFPGYVPEMTCLTDNMPKDIDILFYGAINPRRQAILDELSKYNIKVENFKGYSTKRDWAIARAKLVINIHFYYPAILEIPRLSFLWANKIPVLSEKGEQTSIPLELMDACEYASYDDLVITARKLLRDNARLAEIGERGFCSFSKTNLQETLKKEIGVCIHSLSFSREVPQTLNIGSGKNFITSALNVDINSTWNPDVIFDISKDINFDTKFQTKRFGEIKFSKNMFAKIIAHDVLEHIPDLKKAMTNLLGLLKTGGELEIWVPYDLSYGAWQDPTHLHGFNEKSWRYYTDWFWYLGWTDYRFDIKSLEYIPSELGKKLLLTHNNNINNILTIPRAIDSMQCTLVKRATTNQEKCEYFIRTNYIYKNNICPWIF